MCPEPTEVDSGQTGSIVPKKIVTDRLTFDFGSNGTVGLRRWKDGFDSSHQVRGYAGAADMHTDFSFGKIVMRPS